MKLEEKLKEELKAIENNELKREINELRFISPTVAIDKNNKKYTVFASNNYLGLTHHPNVIEEAKKACNFGTGSTGSRLTTGTSFEALELEKKLANFKHTESSLIFNTGYMTNLGVLYALTDPNDIIFSDALNHASIIDGCKITKATVKIYKHKDIEDLENKIQETDNRKLEETSQKFIVTDGIFSMDGDIAPLPELVKIAKKYNCCLIIDDAHAVGVIGKNGSGTASYFGLEKEVDIQIGTLSKALASEGGYVAGKQVFIDYLINKSRPFIFSTALSPSTIASAKEALAILENNSNYYLEKLSNNTKMMRKLLEEGGLAIVDGETPIIPIIIGSAGLATEFADTLLNKGILVSAIRPPSVPKGSSRLRLTISAAHSSEQIVNAGKIIIETWKKIKNKRNL